MFLEHCRGSAELGRLDSQCIAHVVGASSSHCGLLVSLFQCVAVVGLVGDSDGLATELKGLVHAGLLMQGQRDRIAALSRFVTLWGRGECQSGVNSNKRGCGSPVKAQASARVDVPTERVFPVWTKESNTCASFCCDCLYMCSTGNRP